MGKLNTQEEIIAKVKLVEKYDTYEWVVSKCPVCGKMHSFSGGDKMTNPKFYLGYVTPLCKQNDEKGVTPRLLPPYKIEE